MKKLILLLLLLPFFASAQYTGQSVRKTISDGSLYLSPSGDSLYTRAQTRALIPSVPVGLSDSLAKKANRTFDNVANGAIANVKLANSTISGVALGSNLAGVSPGYGLAGSTYNGSVTRTFTLDTATLSNVYIKNQVAYRQTGAFNVQSDSYIGGIRFGLGGGLDTNNTAIGRGVMRDNLTGKYLTALGYYALRKNLADYNTALGYFALLANTTGTVNTAVGAQALWQNTTGSYNLAIGVEALAANTTGINNTAIGGYDPMISNTIGSANTAVGYAALKDNVDGSDNSVVGSNALSANVSGIRNAAFGSLAGEDNTGSGNTYIGVLAGKDVASGGNNTYLGYQSGLGQTAGSFNIAIGENTVLPSLTGSSQLNIGNTLYGNLSNGNIGIGVASPTTIGSYKVLDISGTSGGYIRLATSGTGRGAIYGNSNGVTMEALTGKVNLIGTTNASTLAGSGDVIVGANNTGDVGKITVGSGLSLTSGILTATGGSSGSVTTSGGTAGRITKFTSASNVENSGLTEASGNLSTSGSMTASSFSGAGTGLTGTAAGLNIGGSATQWNGATRSGSTATTMTHFMSYSGSTFELAPASVAQTFLGLGSNAYTSTAYAPLASPTFTGTVSGITAAMVGAPSGSGTSTGTNTGDQDLSALAPLASPALTGNPTAPTQTAGDNSTKIATTAYVDAAVSTGTSGTYTPTLTNTTNITTSTAHKSQYTRVGNIVTVFGSITIETGSGTTTAMGISLPISSNLATEYDLNGSAGTTNIFGGTTKSEQFYIEADATNDRAKFGGISQWPNETRKIRYSFSYEVL